MGIQFWPKVLNLRSVVELVRKFLGELLDWAKTYTAYIEEF